MPEGQLHFEPFVHLAALDDDQALISWGGFWFRPFEDGRGWRILDDQELNEVDPGRTDSIGQRSRSYGDATVEVFDSEGALVASASTAEENHVWIRGLSSATEYRYEIVVDGQPWVPDECFRWHKLDADRGELRPAGRTYDCRFRTFPEQHEAERLRFAALGDYGVGIQTGSAQGDHQRRIANVLERLVDRDDIDLVVTLGDNIYHQEDDSIGGSGSEDDDWYFSFYEPYRFVISRVPLYPSVGNHDASETEDSDDRDQLADNHFTDLRFSPSVEADRATVRLEGDDLPGLFYRFSYGRLIEFVCIDTSEAAAFEANRFFDDPDHLPFLDEAFDPTREDRGRWLIPFAHHPPFCAGPKHHNDEEQLATLVPRYRRARVQVVLAGHEHNFQHNVHDDIHYFVCGAGAKLREGRPDGMASAHTVSWAATPHLLLCEADADTLTLLPVADLDDGGQLIAVDAERPDGGAEEFPVRIDLVG